MLYVDVNHYVDLVISEKKQCAAFNALYHLISQDAAVPYE